MFYGVIERIVLHGLLIGPMSRLDLPNSLSTNDRGACLGKGMFSIVKYYYLIIVFSVLIALF